MAAVPDCVDQNGPMTIDPKPTPDTMQTQAPENIFRTSGNISQSEAFALFAVSPRLPAHRRPQTPGSFRGAPLREPALFPEHPSGTIAHTLSGRQTHPGSGHKDHRNHLANISIWITRNHDPQPMLIWSEIECAKKGDTLSGNFPADTTSGPWRWSAMNRSCPSKLHMPTDPPVWSTTPKTRACPERAREQLRFLFPDSVTGATLSRTAHTPETCQIADTRRCPNASEEHLRL